jgi:divalent metal cation (Fe/Co/Zn/Cd) transporter
VLFEDTAALVGLLIAFIAISAAEYFQMPVLDGIGSIAIGLVLAATAVLLARESKGLLIGEQALPPVRRKIEEITNAAPDVVRAVNVLTVHLGPADIVAAISVEFRDELTVPRLEACVMRLEEAIQSELPQVTSVFIRPHTARAGEPAEGQSPEALAPAGGVLPGFA